MSSDADRTLLAALDALRVEPARRPPDVPDEVWRLALALVAARRGDLEEETCPSRARHRAHALFDSRRPAVWQQIARLAFDSWARAAPAVRGAGAERMLRYENGSAALDVELSWPAADRVEAHLAVEGSGPGTWVAWSTSSAPAGAGAPLDAQDAAHVVLPAEDGVVLIVGDDDGELLRTPPLLLA